MQALSSTVGGRYGVVDVSVWAKQVLEQRRIDEHGLMRPAIASFKKHLFTFYEANKLKKPTRVLQAHPEGDLAAESAVDAAYFARAGETIHADKKCHIAVEYMLDGQSKAGRVTEGIVHFLFSLNLVGRQAAYEPSRIQETLYLLHTAVEVEQNRRMADEREWQEFCMRGPVQHIYSRKTNFEEPGGLGSSMGALDTSMSLIGTQNSPLPLQLTPLPSLLPSNLYTQSGSSARLLRRCRPSLECQRSFGVGTNKRVRTFTARKTETLW